MTGKPIALGGSEGRGEATGRGCAYVIREAAPHAGVKVKGGTVAVQGYGNAGSVAAKILYDEQGAKIVAASDSQGGIYKADGMNPHAIEEHKAKTGSVVGFPGAKAISNEELLDVQGRHPRPRGAREPDHQEERGQGPGEDRRRGRERPDAARGGQGRSSRRRSSSSRTSWRTPAASP